jgi:hypothetical protein
LANELYCALETRNIRYIVVHQQLKVQQISNRPATPVTLLFINNLAYQSATSPQPTRNIFAF